MKTLSLLLVLAPLALQACAAPATAAGQDKSPAGAPTAASTEDAADVKWKGVLAPDEHAAVSLWPEAYKGEFFVLEAKPHGATVKSGDVLAALETEDIDEMIESAELDVRSASLGHEALLQRNAIAEEEAKEKLGTARAGLDRARRAHDGYMNYEVPFTRRREELSGRWEQSRVDDQTDELEQLRAMYEADELTDATEEIVLMRSERDLELTKVGNAISKDRRKYGEEHEQKLREEELKERLAVQEASLQRLVRSQEIARRERADAEVRSAAKLAKKREHLEELRRDRELFSVRAPRDGVLLHGKAKDYRPGGSSPRVERGTKLATRTDVLLVAAPGSVVVALDLKESELAAARETSAVRVSPLSDADASLSGTLAVESVPAGSQGGEGIFHGAVTLEGGAPELFFGTHVEVTPEASE